MDNLLHYVWQYKSVAALSLQTTNQLPIEVVSPGVRNTSNGPDFLNAKIKIGETHWVGHVLILSSDEQDLKKQLSSDCNSVILCVSEHPNQPLLDALGQVIPQLLLTVPNELRHKFEALLSTDLRPPCYTFLSQLDDLSVHFWLSSLLVERLEEKAERILMLYESKQYHWADILFITLARNFGFGTSGETFEQWAQSLPYRALDKHRDSIVQLEALFFGCAGFLDQDQDDEYHILLKKEFGFLSNKFDLHLECYPWVCNKIRPGNYPNIRIAQLAWFYFNSKQSVSSLLELDRLGACYAFLYMQTSAYWDTHYSFGKISPERKKQLGKKAMDLLIINTIVPFLYAYGMHKGDNDLQQKALDLLSQLKSENNYITRLWQQAGVSIQSAADSQGIIQLHKVYCEQKRCLACRFGYAYLSGK